MKGEPIDMGGTQVEVIEKRRHVPDLTGVDHLDLGSAHVDGFALHRRGKHKTETVDIGFRRYLAAEQAQLLRRDEIVLSGKGTADQGAAANLGRFGDTEIDDFRVADFAMFQDDVVRRQIAVDHAGVMGGLQT